MTQTENPVYQRMVHGAGWPDRRGAAWLSVGAACAGFFPMMLTVWVTLIPDSAATGINLPVLIGALAGLVALLCVPVDLVGAGVLAYRGARPADIALFKLAGLAGKEIAAGYIQGAGYHLRVVHAIGYWFPPGAGLGIIAGGLLAGLTAPQPDPYTPLLFVAALVYPVMIARPVFVLSGAVGIYWANRPAGDSGLVAAALVSPLVVCALTCCVTPWIGLLGLLFLPIFLMIARDLAMKLAVRTIDTTQEVRE